LSARMMANYHHSHFITPFSLFRRIHSSNILRYVHSSKLSSGKSRKLPSLRTK
jgi:hypothetical protein